MEQQTIMNYGIPFIVYHDEQCLLNSKAVWGSLYSVVPEELYTRGFENMGEVSISEEDINSYKFGI